MEPSDHPLEPDRATAEAWLARLAGLALDHADALAAGPAIGAVGARGLEIAADVSTPIPEEPLTGGVGAAAELIERATRASLVTPGPGYLAFVPGSGLWTSALADLVSGTLNRFTGHSAAAPGPCRLETDVLEWLAHEFGYGEDSRGLFTSGGSIANLVAMITARDHRIGDTGDFRSSVAYTSEQAHHCVLKGLRLAGIPSRNLVTIPVDAQQRMDVGALTDRIVADRAAGLSPFLIVSSAGTTNTGAVDPLPAIADVADRNHLWHHVDGAYGGAFVLCPRGREVLAGIELADSITFDPHKGLFLPFGTGCLLVRDGRHLRRAHRAHGAYMQDFEGFEREGEPPSATEHGPELSRSFRGLRLWLPLMLHGARAFREALAEKLLLAEQLHDGLLERIDAGAPLEVVAAPQLSTVAFRLARTDDEPLDAWNGRNAALNDAVNAGGRVFLSSTSLPVGDGDAFTLRACVLGFRTHADRIDALLEDLDRALQGTLAVSRLRPGLSPPA